MLDLDTVEKCSFNLFHRSLELLLPITHDMVIGDKVTVISCMTALSYIFHISTFSDFSLEDEVEMFISLSSRGHK